MTQGNFKKQKAKHDGNFTILSNEIFFAKDKDGNFFAPEVIGIFCRLMSLKPNWHLNYAGLAARSNCSVNKIKRIMQQLQEAGYIKIDKYQKDENNHYVGCYYTVYESLDPNNWVEDEEDLHADPGMDIFAEDEEIEYVQNGYIQNGDIQTEYVQNEYIQNEYIRNEYIQNGSQYNINNNKILKNIKYLKNKNGEKISPCENSSQISKNINLTPLDLNNTNLINQGCAKGSQKGSSRQQKAADRRAQREQEFNEKIEQEQNKQYESVSNLVTNTVGDLNELDNLKAKVQKMENVAKEQQLDAQKRKGKKIGAMRKMQKLIDNLFNTNQITQDIVQPLKDYFELWVDKGKPITEGVLKHNIAFLKDNGKTSQEQLQILDFSTQNGYLKLVKPEQKVSNPIKGSTYKPYNTTNNVDTVKLHDIDLSEYGMK